MTDARRQTLKLRRVAIDTYKENVAYLHRACAVYRTEGFQALTKLEVRTGEGRRRRVLAVLNVVDDESITGCEELGLSEQAFEQLGLPEGRSVRVAHADGEWFINPTYAELEEADWNIIVSAAKAGIVMVEAGGTEVGEDIVLESIDRGHEAIKTIIAGIEELVAKAGKPKLEVTAPEFDDALLEEVFAKWGEDLEDALAGTG